ncbi:MAG: cation-translocating P-type ATPase [Caldimonas sp.]
MTPRRVLITQGHPDPEATAPATTGWFDPVQLPGDGPASTLLDDPAGQAGFTTFEQSVDGTRIGRSHLQLAGLWCAGCAGLIEQALLHESGVIKAQVSYATSRAVVAWNPAATRFTHLLDAVRRAGYGAAPDAAAPARVMRQAEQRSALWRLFVASFCMMQVMMYAAPLYWAAQGTLAPDLRTLLLWAAWLLSIPVVLFSAAPMFRDAWQSLRQRRIGMDVPVAIGVAVTFIVSSGATFDPHGPFGHEAYFDSLTMFVTFLLAGRYLALKLRNRVAAALEGAMSPLPAGVHRLEPDGSTSEVALHDLRCGDRVRVLPGEAFPADGRVLEGSTAADEALLTGESRPVDKQPGDEAIAGSLNLRGAVVQLAERLGADTRHDGIVALLRGAMNERPPLLRAADRVAGPFLWAVLLLAAGAAAVWSVIDPSRAVWVAVSVLIVTCPCALSLAAPSAYLAAAAALVRRGVLVQRLEALEALASLDTVCFDKTGTVTDGRPEVTRVDLQPAALDRGLDETAVRALAASLAAGSTHPVARAIGAGAPARSPEPVVWRDVREEAGFGLEGTTSLGHVYRLGAADWAGSGRTAPTTANLAARVSPARSDEGPQAWLVGPDGPLAGFFLVEAVRPDARATVEALQRAGLDVHLLSGDRSDRVNVVADRLGIEHAEGDATPADKLAAMAALQGAGRRVGMVGDGLNDAPVMARADVSFAIGDGTALTRAKADFVLVSGRLADIAWARDTARRAMRVVRQNLGWAIAYNAACVPLALLGLFPPWAAGLGMATSSLVVVLNAARIDRIPRARSARTGQTP